MKTNILRYIAPVMMVAPVFGQNVAPKDGFVPDSTTAQTIAEAVLVPVYGKVLVESERPFTAILKDDVWTVTGTMQCPDGKQVGSSLVNSKTKSLYACLGGTAIVKIWKIDGHIISMIHGK
jgi:NTF2 fold immunity protein